MANPAPLLVGGSVAALLGAALLSRPRSTVSAQALVVYIVGTPDDATFEGAAEIVADAYGTIPVPVEDGQELIDAIRLVPSIDPIALIGHGTTTQFLRPGVAGLRVGASALPRWVGVEDLARELAPRLVRDFWFPLLGCRAAANPGEPDWSELSREPGGEHSLAGQLRDALVRAGAPYGRVAGHSTTGTVLDNPAGREFEVIAQRVGEPGTAVALTQGIVARNWAITGEF